MVLAQDEGTAADVRFWLGVGSAELDTVPKLALTTGRLENGFGNEVVG